ncbi:MAG: YfcE family phosphodiesterase [bacterium]
MKIAVISDIHGNMAYLGRAKKIIDDKKLSLVICCGDMQDIETFSELDSWSQKVYCSLGNADYEIRYRLDIGTLLAKKMEIFLDYGVLNIDGSKIAFCHYPKFAKKLAEDGRYDVVFYGHNHKPWEEKIGNTVLLNPGELQARDGKPTFAIYDLKNMSAELKLLV